MTARSYRRRISTFSSLLLGLRNRRDGLKLPYELIARNHDWITPESRHWQGLLPSVAWRIHEERVPHRVRTRWQSGRRASSEDRWQPIHVQLAEDARFIPVVRHPRVGEKRR